MSEHHEHTQHTRRAMVRHCDVVVVGGSAAGLAAALQLGRQRRSVIVVDAGDPRNAPAAHMHGFLGHEGITPGALVERGRAEVRSYGGEVLRGRVTGVSRVEDGFSVELDGPVALRARRVLVATGITDLLPAIDGVERHWGRDVIHCPFCHGYEVRDAAIVQIVTNPLGLHPAALFAALTDRLTVVVHGEGVTDDELAPLQAGGVTIERIDVARLVGDERLEAVELADGRRLEADAVAIMPAFRARIEPFADLGLAAGPHPSGLGDHVETGPMGQTSVPGLYAAGNVVDPSLQVLPAAAEGSRAGAMIAADLAGEDLEVAAERIGGNRRDWDARYGGEQQWSGNPNGSLVVEAESLTPGRALDVGAGEGGDAVWLAEQGWEVTALDIARSALDRLGDEAERRGLEIETRCVDANLVDSIGEGFDLVSACYASVHRTADDRFLKSLLAAVAPGGSLVVVGHDLAPMREHSGGPRAFDPDAYVGVQHVAEALADDPDWKVEVHELRPRPAGAASAGHHVDDEVFRARRLR